MLSVFKQFDIWALIDVIIIALLFYNTLVLLRGTRAAQMLTGVLFIVGVFFLANLLPLTTLRWIMSKFYSSFLIILVILFQEDIRNVLRKMGLTSFKTSNELALSQGIFDEIIRAAFSMSKEQIGGLIVFERNILLSNYIEAGVHIDAQVSTALISSIFNPSTPLHDGAMIIQGGRIAAASCFLPLAKAENLGPSMGTRHRAAIGVSEETDALVIVVSEVTREVSIALEGKLHRNLNQEEIMDALKKHLKPRQPEKKFFLFNKKGEDGMKVV